MPVMLFAVAVFVLAGNWQRDRMEQKAALRAQYETLAQRGPGPLPHLDRASDWASERFRPVILRGEYDAAHQILIDNRIRGGRAGYEVVTPMKLADGRLLLVNRGWVALGASREVLPQVPPPEGTVDVQGRISMPSPRYLELGTKVASGSLWQNLDPARFAESTGLPMLPVVVEQSTAPVPDDGLVRDWPLPDLGIDKHRMYMLQWYALAALAVVLWAALGWRKSRRGKPKNEADRLVG